MIDVSVVITRAWYATIWILVVATCLRISPGLRCAEILNARGGK